MTAQENPKPTDPVDTVLKALEKGDAVAAASAYAEDAVFIDPRYPEPEYRGREPIREAFEWGHTNVLDEPEYTVRNYLETGQTCVVEVHAGDAETTRPDSECPRVFVVDFCEEGITRWRTYLPFKPR